MSIFRSDKTKQLQTMTAQVEEFQRRVDQYQKVQELLGDKLLTLQADRDSYVGNDYRNYEGAVRAIEEKYLGKAEWGCLQTAAIIKLRAGFILGDGVKIIHKTNTRSEAEKELKWAEDFFSWNDLDAENAPQFAREAEIDGKIAIKLIYEEKKWRDWPGMVSARFIPWASKKYTITADPDDYAHYKELTWKATGTMPAGKLPEEQFIYKKFGGRINKPNDAQPQIMHCLTQVDRLDHALRDLRQVNHFHASPTPHIHVESIEDAKAMLKNLQGINWKIGKLLIHTGEFGITGAPIGGNQNLENEILMIMKIISGITGIPIHYLGPLDLLKNRATGDNTRELIIASTAYERKTWIGAYEELITKAMEMFNAKAYAQKSGPKLDPEKIGVNINIDTQEAWDHIEKVLIPAATAGIISNEHVAEQIPGVDAEKEAERAKERDDSDLERMKSDANAIRANKDIGGDEGDEGAK